MKTHRFYVYLQSYPTLSNAVKHFNGVMKASIFVMVLFLFGCSSDQNAQMGAAPPPSLPVWEIKQGSEVTYQEYPASIDGIVNIEIRPQVEGILDQVLVDEGAFVQKGQALFKINDRPYREQLNASRASLNAAEGAVENAQLEIEKLKPLVENHVVSDFQIKSARAAYRVALGNLEQAKANVAAAKINLGYTVITAPVSGYIGRLQKKQGSLLSPSDMQPLTQLSDVHEMHAYFSIGESDFVTFKAQYPGATLKQKLNNMPPVSLILSDQSTYPFEGKVDMVDGQFDKNTGAITLRASFPNKEGLLRAGNTGRVKLALQHSNALIVPQSATIEIQDKIFVYALGDSNKVNKKPISVIGKSGPNYIISEGLKSGDKIVYKGIEHLQEDQVIKPEPLKPEDRKLTALN